MSQISFAEWLMGCGQLVPGEVPENGTWWIREEQHSSLKSSSSPCTAAMHEVRFPVSAGAAAEQKNLLACGQTDLHRLLLSTIVVERHASYCGDNTFLPIYIMVIWRHLHLCSHSYGRRVQTKAHSDIPYLLQFAHPEEIPKLFWCSSLKLSLMVHFLNPPEGDKILFHLISILSLLTM